MKKVIVLGSTGSVGSQTLEVIRAHPDRFEVVGLAAASNVQMLARQARQFQPDAVALAEPDAARRLESLVKPHIEILSGQDGVCQLAAGGYADIVVAAISGFAGVRPTLAASRSGSDIALANKEAIVCAGEVIMDAISGAGSRLLPVDSEHNALFQCINGESQSDVRRLVLTASGGPFWGASREQLEQVTAAEALDHPSWDMGSKITVDSATLMNKGLEVIEAHWLFDVEFDSIDVVIHPQSVVHSLVEFVDGSYKAEMGPADMRYAIQYALSYPERWNDPGYSPFGLPGMNLEFDRPDEDAFPCLRLAREAGRQGGVFPTLLVAADDVAVEAFLQQRISFLDIPRIVEMVMGEFPVKSSDLRIDDGADRFDRHVQGVLRAGRWAQDRAEELVEEHGK